MRSQCKTYKFYSHMCKSDTFDKVDVAKQSCIIKMKYRPWVPYFVTWLSAMSFEYIESYRECYANSLIYESFAFCLNS